MPRAYVLDKRNCQASVGERLELVGVDVVDWRVTWKGDVAADPNLAGNSQHLGDVRRYPAVGVDAHAEELGTLVTKENGKKIAEGLFEGTSPSPTLRHNAAQALTDTGISAEVAPGQWFSTYAEPAGVVGIIVPWNSPVALLIRSLAPALSAGNTVAVKMPGQTALVANLVSQIIAEVTSLPRGVVNIFTESGNTGAPYLVASPDVQVISYTGSTTVGRIVAANGAPTLKRMNLELGGKTPMIVFDDADLDATVPLLAAGITTFGGEFCMTGSRILVQRGVADEVRTRLAGLLENVRVGDGMDPQTDMGPLIDKADVTRVDGLVQAALAYAKPIVRGGPGHGPGWCPALSADAAPGTTSCYHHRTLACLLSGSVPAGMRQLSTWITTAARSARLPSSLRMTT